MIISRRRFQATVSQNLPLCRDHFKLVLRVEQFPPTEPGQFIQILCRDGDETAFREQEARWDDAHLSRLKEDRLDGPMALLRRPFSLAGRRDLEGAAELDIIHRVVGIGTAWLA